MQPDEIFEFIKKQFPQAAQEEGTKAVVIPKDVLLNVAGYLRNRELAFDNLHCLTAIDRKERIELVYIFFSTERPHSLTMKIYLLPDDLNVESVAPLFRSANWFEREIYDLFGVSFLNHPDLRRILNPDSWKVHPLRKDFSRADFIKKAQ